MLRYTILLCIFCLLQSASGQSSFLKGYVVNLNGDTTYLDIKDKSLGKKSFIKVREQGKTKELPLNQLRYFRIIGYELYKIDSSKAYNVLLQGEISLLFYDGSYWLEKGNQKVRLKNAIRTMKIGGIQKDMKIPVWRNELGRLAGKCTQIAEDSKLHKRDLIKILESYHNCSGIPFRIIQNSKMTFAAQIHAGIEPTQSIVNVEKQRQLDEPITILALPDGPNFFMAPTYYSSDIFYNTNISIFIDRKHQFSVESGLNFGSADFSSTELGALDDQLYHSAFAYKSVTIPLSLRYENEIGKLIVSGSGGMIYGLNSDIETDIFIDSGTTFGRVVNKPVNPAILDSSLLGFLFQIGAKYQFKNFFTGVNGKYYSQIGFNQSNTVDANYIRLSMELFLGYKLNLKK